MLHFTLKRAILAALDPLKWEKKCFLDINLKQFWIFWYQLLTVKFLHRLARLFKVKVPFFGCYRQKNIKKLTFFAVAAKLLSFFNFWLQIWIPEKILWPLESSPLISSCYGLKKLKKSLKIRFWGFGPDCIWSLNTLSLLEGS